MDALVASVITGVVTALLAAAGTYYTTRRSLQVQYDADLRRLRIDAYKDLWKRLDALAKYGRSQILSRSEARALGQSLRQWYFKVGGIFLSAQTRRDYFALQDAIEDLVARETPGDLLSTADDDFLRVLSSRLRAGMTRDVGTRQTFMFRGDTTADKPPGNARFRERDGDRQLILAAAVPVRLRPPGRRWWRRQRAGDATIEVKPSGRGVKGVTWNPERGAFELDTTEGGDSRVLLSEGGDLIEGPAGWRRHAAATSDPAVVWVPAEKPEGHHGT